MTSSTTTGNGGNGGSGAAGFAAGVLHERDARGDELAARAERAVLRGLENLARRQGASGSWPADYGGPMFLLPMYVALCRVAGEPIAPERAARMVTYFTNVQRDDGSVGLHAEATSGSMFTTAITYVALRHLGLPADDARVKRMRAWMHDHGTALGAASWGKFTLCLLGLYDWRGIHPVSAELWLLPYALPLHPARLWCHARQVYLPMAWLYARRATMPADALTLALRDELYGEGRYDEIPWSRHRDTTAAVDDYRATTTALRVTNRALAVIEAVTPRWLRKRALGEVMRHIEYEDRVTGQLALGPVNAVLDVIVHVFRAREPGAAASDAPGKVRGGFAALERYLWDGHDGLKMQGYVSSELWDTAFAVQAFVAAEAALPEARVASVHDATLRRAYGYVRDNQNTAELPAPERHYRDRLLGAWGFGPSANGWPVSDCTAEGLAAALLLEGRWPEEKRVPDALLREAVKRILAWQNADGGFPTYERKRGGAWLEKLNPSQVFGDIMVDYSHVECTAACIQGLVRARKRFPGEFDAQVADAIARGEAFIRAHQREDGSFEGFWGVCFTYGTYFAISGLRAAGAGPTDPAVRRACAFLLARQKADGSWGEHGDSCRERRWVEHPRGQVAQTAWALSALVRAESRERAAMARAAEFLLARQRDDGGWAREALVGVFNRTCLINYDVYRHYFPVWALSEWIASERRASR